MEENFNTIDEEKKVVIDSNEEIWNKETYDAWVNRFGTPEEAAARIKKNPEAVLSILYSKLGDVKGKRIMNLMGSNGNKAVALALLGAEVTVVDFSEGNKNYALELAKAADVKIDYIVSDVLKLPKEKVRGDYDIVFAEMGIIHYFTDLAPFMKLMYELLSNKGIALLRDFHPVSTKLISSRGSTAKVRKHKVTGDYFDTSLEEKDVSYFKYSEDDVPKKVFLRKWTLGEVVTSVANSGLVIKSLDEEPNLSSEVFDKGIPKTFTVMAEKL
ncbi:class I SAM-dependent methyltransferase [Clostridium manihotivorum]|uniref:SAM-dependent methyltransferase n=1 Tax=Clostridium manihotivorum TaxID=2320868 RepID=A0A410DPE6_9CLOT|nr:class I SAM-dependent methyltransferase [Clostridium manihotivorum]QAA30930.1 SAM-dependent methyltransferase [Clostridium manihotivorum]